MDGDLAEWDDPPYGVESAERIDRGADGWSGPEDASFRFDVGRDEDNCYVAIEIRDDILIHNPDRDPDEQDSLEIWVDAGPAKGEDDLIELVLTLNYSAEKMSLVGNDGLPEGIEIASSKKAGGFGVEIAIPQTLLDERQDGEWETLRINIRQNDRDLKGRTTSLQWRPNWNAPASYDHSGTFRIVN